MLAGVFGVLALAACTLTQDPAPALTAQVNRAIARGVEHLRSLQRADGTWGGAEGEHPGGVSALCTFTLLKSGVRRTDDSVRRALTPLLATEFKSTYSHSVRLLMLEALAQPEAWRERAEASLDFLVATQVAGEWAYPWGAADASNTQFALLGLRAAQRLGLEIPDATLLNAVKALVRLQDKSGGFKYLAERAPTGGVTAASLAGLCVLHELGAGRPVVESALRKIGKEESLGRTWLEGKWSAEHNAFGTHAWTPSFHYPYLWAVERYGGLSAQPRLGAHDWYSEGALWLVEHQNPDGGWSDRLEDACFALLFLRRATVSRGDEVGETDAELDRPRAPRVEPAPGVPRVVDWLVAGPVRSDNPADPFAKLPFDPRKLVAREGDKLAKRDWRRLELKRDGWSDFDELLGVDCDGGFVAAALTLVWPLDAPLEATLWLEVEDRYDVYLDGTRLATTQRIAGAIDGREALHFELARGEHRLVCLIEDFGGAAAFGARITARDGRALERPPQMFAVQPKGKAR